MSSTAIMNMALDLLDEEAILDASDDRTVVRWMNRNFGPVRDSLLRLHPWNFAKRRAALPARSTAPAFGFTRAFPKPAGCLRVLPLASLGARNGHRVDFSIEGPDILTNAGSPLQVIYIARVEDDGLFDPLFTQYLAATLGTRAANYVTGKQSYAERVGQIAKDLRGDAQMVNGLEGVPEQSYDDDWVGGRHTGVLGEGWDTFR